ncbi:methionyl-tRNA formyltransferase [Mycobacteroides abscessus subsp. abscessus]|nr:methionyl-tRNA formyltransferase [Mycobacteroides abscessus subsp. abscessus]
MTPEPGAWTNIGEMRIKVGPVGVATDEQLPPGAVVVRKRDVLVGTGTTAIALDEVQPQGKKVMKAADWARGARLDAEVHAL